VAHAPSQGVTRETTRALLRLIVWLTVLAYILDLKPTLRLVSDIIWLGAFLWMYVYRIGKARFDPRSKYYYEELPLRLPRRLVPHTVALMVLVAASLPWSGAFFTGGCAKAGWFNNVWPTGEILASRSVFFIGTLSLLIGTATFPLVEEFTFRGWLLRSWTRKLGRNWAVLLTSALFAVGHFTFHAGLLLSHFVFGLLLALAVLSANSLWIAFAMHYSYNLTNELMTVPPLHTYVGNLFQSGLFRCDASGIITGLGLLLMLGVMLDARRAQSAI